MESTFMPLLDQYLLKKFLVPFLYCIIGFVGIWLIWDLSSNAPDFVQGHISLGMLVKFYATQIPQVIVLSMPVGTLLALLYSFTQMSRRTLWHPWRLLQGLRPRGESTQSACRPQAVGQA